MRKIHLNNFLVPIAVVVGVPLLIWVRYILFVDWNTIQADQFPLLFDYDSFVEGNRSLADLWAPKGGHRFPGYQLLFYINIYFFGFSPQLETIASICIFALAVFYLSNTLAKDLHLRPWIIWLVCLTFALIFFNGQSLRLVDYSLIATRVMNFAGFVLLAAICYHLVCKPSPHIRNWLYFGLCLIFVILFFGRGWGIAVCAAIVSIAGIHWLSHKERFNSKAIVPHFAVVSLILLTVFIYMSGLKTGTAQSSTGFDLTQFVNYYLTKMGNANLGIFDVDLSRVSPLAMGVSLMYILATGLITLHLIWRGSITRAEWMALFLIYFSLFAAGVVAVSRYDQTPFFPRHNIELAIGFCGIYFFACKYSVKFFKERLSEIVVLSVSFFVVFGLTHRLIETTGSAKYLFKFADRLESTQQKAIQNPELMTSKDYRKMRCALPQKECREAAKLMQKYGVAKSRMAEPRRDDFE